MRSRNAVVLVGVVVLLLVIMFVVWTRSYNSGLVREWSSLQQKLVELDTRIASTNCDLADIDKSTKQLKSCVDEVRVAMTVRAAPPFSGRKRLYFIDYLDKTSATLAAVSLNCSVWSASEISKLDQASEAMRNAQTTCALALGCPASKSDTFVSTSSTFNKMWKARKKPKNNTGAIVVSPVPTMTTSFVMPTDPYLANYISRMQSLLREYKVLRSGLDRYIEFVKRTGQSLEGSAYTTEFDAAIAARQSVLNQINAIVPPTQYASQHQEAAACVQYGIEAMIALKRGDYPSFHSMSEQNTPRLARIRSVYGF